jgi:tRNA U34 2-thiouridine synthase MnmA/TrmU
MAKAIALLSGGLDSSLAVLTLLGQGVEVTAVTFLTHFGCDISDSSSCSKDPFQAAQKFGFQVKLCHLADKFIGIVKNPKHGHGKNMNPCIDCRILMLREARSLMELTGADFLVTGEVLGQRPMSQRRDTFPVIDREAGVEGLVLRPLSAKLLKPTRAEISGLVTRDKLHAFSGRTRKPQIALARELGLTDYPAPAGGCLLTDPIYSYRLKDLLAHDPDPSVRDITLLKYGRHFRYSPSCRIIVGRNKEDNDAIESLVSGGDTTLSAPDTGSPLTLVAGAADDAAVLQAASLTARYCDKKTANRVTVSVFRGMDIHLQDIAASPADALTLDAMRIEEKSPRKKSPRNAKKDAVGV